MNVAKDSMMSLNEAWNEPPDLDVKVYSTGLFYLSACAPKGMSAQEVSEQVNVASPSGTERGWWVADEGFHTGEKNGCPCDDDPEKRRHWLFVC